MNSTPFRLLRVAGCAFAFSAIAACSMSNVQMEKTNQKLDALDSKLDAQLASAENLESGVASLSDRQAQLESQLELLQASMDTVTKEQARVRAAAKKVVSAEKPQQAQAQPANAQGKLSLGRVEWIWLPKQGRYLAAQLDTSAPISILFAENVVSFERDGDRWLRFNISRDKWDSTVEAKLHKTEKFSYYGLASVKGPLVDLPVRVADFNDEIRFIVIEKKKDYPQMILGKNFLTDVATVDVSNKYLQKKEDALEKLERKNKRAYRAAKNQSPNVKAANQAVAVKKAGADSESSSSEK